MLNKETEKRIDSWIELHREEYLKDLGELIAMPSVANLGVAEGEFPFGEQSAAALKKAKKLAEGYGFTVKNLDNFCLVANVGSGKEKAGILGHLDVVPCGDDWTFPPFALTRNGDMLSGRGVLDDKGPLWASVYAVRCLKELGLLPKREIEIFMGGDEECGMEDIKHYKAVSEKLPVVAFTPDAAYPICHGEKGIMRLHMIIPNGGGSNIVEFKGGIARNVVAGHAEILLSGICGKEAEEKFFGEDEFTVKTEGEFVRISAEGKSVHASKPDNGVNAIGILAKAVSEKGLVRGEGKAAAEFIAKVLSDCHGKSIGVPFEDEPSGKLSHVAGLIKTEGGKLDMTIDIRYPVTESGERVLKNITGTVAPFGVRIEDVTASDPLYISADSELVKACMETVKGVFGREDWKPYTMGGGTYARNMKNAYALGAEDPDYKSPFGAFRGSIHQPDETASAEQLFNTMKVYARLLLRLDDFEF